MPLLVRGLPRPAAPGTPIPPAVPPPPPPLVPFPPLKEHFVDRPRLTWISPTNEVWDLGTLDETETDTRLFALRDVKGLGAAPRTFTADMQPRGGTRVRHIQPDPRLITLPMVIEGKDAATFIDLWRRLAQSFTDTRFRGPGRLQVHRSDGTAREILAYYQEGWEPNPDGDNWWDTVAVTLYCEDPFFRDTAATILGPYKAPTPLDYLDPFIQVTSSQTLGAVSLFNPGGVEAWPDWVIKGPADKIVATNHSTGESFTLDVRAWRGGAYGLLESEKITISTEPPTVRGPDGSNWVGALNWPGCVLWGLLPGTNEVEFRVDNVLAPFELTMSFYARYETA